MSLPEIENGVYMVKQSWDLHSLVHFINLRRHILHLSLCFVGIMTCSACEEPVECLIDSSCQEGLVCVNTVCVGTEISPNSESWTMYKEEIHNRLAADCGICHGVRGELPPVTYGQEPVDPQEGPQKVSVRDLIQLPVQTGDSGWRIYLDNLTEERLFDSYLDTLQFINQDAPERSMLLGYGRGEININGLIPGENKDDFIPVPHPKVYDIPQVGEPVASNCTLAYAEIERENPQSPADPNQDPPLPPPNVGQVSHQRLLGWAKLDHSTYKGVWPYTLKSYQAQLEPVINASCACHKAANDIGPNQNKQGGFCFPTEAQTEAEIHIWASMINVSDPDSSAILHFLNGDFDHKYQILGSYEDQLPKLKKAILNWIEDKP